MMLFFMITVVTQYPSCVLSELAILNANSENARTSLRQKVLEHDESLELVRKRKELHKRKDVPSLALSLSMHCRTDPSAKLVCKKVAKLFMYCAVTTQFVSCMKHCRL